MSSVTSLKDILLNDFKEALKTKDNVRKDTIQIVRAGVLQVEKDTKTQLDDTGVIDILSKELKKRYDVLPDYKKSGRQDAIDELYRQIDVLKSYLPKQLSEDEIADIVKNVINEIGALSPKDMGKVMQALTPKIKGRADTKAVSELVKKNLQSI